MRLRSNIHRSGNILIDAHKAFPSINFLSRNGNPRPSSSIAPKNGPKHIPTHHHLISILKISKKHRSLHITKMAHASILRSIPEFNLFVWNNLLHCYCSCGSTANAAHLFDRMFVRDVVSWNTMISGYVGSRLVIDGFLAFRSMMRLGILPTQSSFASVLPASAEMGTRFYLHQVHGVCLKSGFISDCCIGNALLNGLVEYGEVDDLRRLSEEMHEMDEISFEILLKGYKRHGVLDDAFELLRYSCQVGVSFNPCAFSNLISLCTSLQHIECGMQVHGHAIKVCLGMMHVSAVNSLISLYSRAHRLGDAELLFYWCRSRDIVTWNSLINGFAYNGEGDAGVGLVQRLMSSGIGMNESTFLSFLSCCAAVTVLENARRAHVLILKFREHFDLGVDNIILTMYNRCRSLREAETVFEAMEVRNIMAFNSMLSLYRKLGNYTESILLLPRAQLEGVCMDELMLASVLSSCSKLGSLDIGQQLHSCIIKTAFDDISCLKNSLLEMYSQCGRIDDMEKAFHQNDKSDLFSWNMMLMGYGRYGLLNKSIEVWQEMENSSLKPNEFSYSALLDTCNSADSLMIGQQIHGRIQKMGLLFDTTLMNSLVTMYSNCQMMDKALEVFKEISLPDTISWNAMVSGYAQNGLGKESVKFYLAMSNKGIETSQMTFASISMASAIIAELKLGTQFHAQVIKRAFESNLSVSNSLITMYAKCGGIHEFSKVFERTFDRDVITWNSLICAYAYHGQGKDAINVFEQMKVSGFKPNDVTFIGVLSACSRAGLISEACYMFRSMYDEYSIAPSEEHYTCMVDILCRAGKLIEAKDLIESMPFDPGPLIWRTLLSACKVNGYVKLGEVAAERIIHLEPQDSASYVLLSNLYASVGKRRHKDELRRLMKDRGVKKEVGYSWIQC